MPAVDGPHVRQRLFETDGANAAKANDKRV